MTNTHPDSRMNTDGFLCVRRLYETEQNTMTRHDVTQNGVKLRPQVNSKWRLLGELVEEIRTKHMGSDSAPAAKNRRQPEAKAAAAASTAAASSATAVHGPQAGTKRAAENRPESESEHASTILLLFFDG